MKLTELPKITEKTEVEETSPLVEALDVSDEELALIAGVTKADPDYQTKINDLKRMKKFNPRLYNKIVNFD